MDDLPHPIIGTIRVVWIDLDLSPDIVEELRPVLSPAEQQRVARFSSLMHQRRATVRLARRRQILADIFDIAPHDVIMRLSASGKPFAISPTEENFELSTAQCGDLGLVAVAGEGPVGVDVEAASELPDYGRFASWVATAHETRQIIALPRCQQQDAFLRLWTRKEAYLKATGMGIGAGIQHIEVPLDADPWGQLFQPLANGASWLLYQLPCPRLGFNASLVTLNQGNSEHKPEINVTHL